tara:strand:+ start:724 stop:1647 length:924 start_codon:yes stop_codon:yes gene_type:complete
LRNINLTKEFKIKTIFITGSGGFLGSELVNGLSKYNYKIFCNDINFSYKILKSKNIKKLKFNLFYSKIPIQLDEADIFIHNAAVTKSIHFDEPNKLKNFNIKLTKNALNLARICNSKKFFLISSTSVYRNFKSQKYNERSSTKGGDAYSKSKILSEKICREFCKKYKIKLTILRIGNIYNGKEKKKWSRNNISLVQQWLNASKKNVLLKTSSFLNLRDWTYSKDIPRLINSIIKNNSNFKILNLVSPYLINDYNLMKKICSNKKLLVSENKLTINNAAVSIYNRRLKFNDWTSPQRGINLIKSNEKN